MKNIRSILFALFASLFLFSSCKKEEEKDRDIRAAVQAVYAENFFTDLKMICDEATDSLSTGGILAQPGIAVSRHTASTGADSILIDFGTLNIACADERMRRGKIYIRSTGNYADSGAVTEITFGNYFCDDQRISGSDSLYCLGPDTSGTVVYNSVIRSYITLWSGGSIAWWSNKKIRKIAGNLTSDVQDDVYEITGFANGSQHTGRNFTSQIGTPMIKKRTPGCNSQIIQGTLTVMPYQKGVSQMDTGSGACDYDATVTLGGEIYHVTME